jgi:hypothetical protein
MSGDELETLYMGMQKIEARKMLKYFTIGDYPNMKSEDRSKLHRSTFKIGYPNAMKKRAVKVSDLKGFTDIATLGKK